MHCQRWDGRYRPLISRSAFRLVAQSALGWATFLADSATAERSYLLPCEQADVQPPHEQKRPLLSPAAVSRASSETS